MNPQKIYHCWPSDGFLWPSFGKDNAASELEREQRDKLRGDLPIAEWSSWKMIWLKERRKSAKPDLTYAGAMQMSCSRAAARGLWTQGTRDFELYPFTIDGEPWHALRALRRVDVFEPANSHIEWNEWQEPDGTLHKTISHIPWINVIDLRALEWDAFTLSLQPRGSIYYTQRFVDRYEALGLKGVFFQHMGYIVDKPENAISPPPRPAPEIPPAPRWPKWEPAPDEEVVRYTEAGQSFLQARGLNESSSPPEILNSLAAEIEAQRPGFSQLKPKPSFALLMGLAGAFGLLVRQQLNWTWVDLQVTSKAWDLGLESPNGSHALCLSQVMVRQLTSREPSTIVLLFNMIAAGNLPEGQAGDRVAIG